jgi:hypothetical protein
MYLLAICNSSFKNSLFNSCANFFIGILILIKEMKVLLTKNYKILINEIKDTQINQKIFNVQGS